MYIFDTREQTNEHIKRYFDKHGIAYKISKLKTGDYAIEENPGIIIERKKNLSELAHNLLTSDRRRFYAEIRRARAEGIRLIILCEHGPDIKTFSDVKTWVPKYGKANGKALADAIFRLEIGYGVPVLYCSKQSTGKRIVEILNDEGYRDDH